MPHKTQRRRTIALALLARTVPLGEHALWQTVVAHSHHVALLAAAAAARLGLPEDERELVEIAALLHDIGKARVPADILAHPGRLDDRQWALVRAHSEAGERIVASVPAVADAAPIVRHVHERWDGRGYPDGLAGEAIPRAGRLIAACDAYVAMVERRPYGPPLPPAVALAELAAGTGAQFAPGLLPAVAMAVRDGTAVCRPGVSTRMDGAGRLAGDGRG